MPRGEDLRKRSEFKLASSADLLRDLDDKGLTWNDYMLENPPSNPGDQDPFPNRLDDFLGLLFYCLDHAGRGAAAAASEKKNK